MSLVVTCGQCRELVLEAGPIGDEEECALRDHRIISHLYHSNTPQPETLTELLRHFVITEPVPPVA